MKRSYSSASWGQRSVIGIVALGAGLSACRACSKDDGAVGPASPPSVVADASVVAEVLPRCRAGTERIGIAGDEVVMGDVAIGKDALYAGVIRLERGKRIGSVLRAPLDLSTSRMIDVGPPFGDDPPPSPRLHGSSSYVAFYSGRSSDAGARVRPLTVARLDDGAVGKVEGTIVQQADESTDFDVAWNDSGVGLVAWDEDAPPPSDGGDPASGAFEGRGFVKVQVLGSSTRRVASPESSDAESPRLLTRSGGGFWLAWLARRGEEEAYSVEGPGERRAFRWVEAVALTATGEAAGPVRRVSSEKGRATSFELGRSGDELVVLVQDEAAVSEGGGARLVRYVVGAKIESAEVVDGGVGSTLAELVPVPAGDLVDGGARWLAFTDGAERLHVAPLGRGLLPVGQATPEPSLDGSRVLASVSPDRLYALVLGSIEPGKEGVRPELRRFTCSPLEGAHSAEQK